MTAYLLTWNPKLWAWDTLHRQIAEIDEHGKCPDRWGCGNTRKIRPGDRLFLMRLGVEPRGLIGSGWAVSSPYEAIHWGADQDGRRITTYIEFEFDALLDPEQSILPLGKLESDYPSMQWSPRRSGTMIPDDIVEQLEEDWARLLA